MADENPLLKKAVSLNGSADAIRDFYSEWSDNYDKDLLEDIGYVGPKVTAEALSELIGDHAFVLDAGCGTGLVAVELHKRKSGLTIDGIDLTPAMLDLSRSRNAYRKLDIADMSGPLDDIADNSYDAVVCAGVFTNGHVGPDGLDALIRVARPGASLVFTVRDSAWEADGFKDKVATLEADTKTRTVSIVHSPYHTKEDIFCQLVVLEVL